MREEYKRNQDRYVKIEKRRKIWKTIKYIFVYLLIAIVVLAVGVGCYFIKEYKPMFDTVYNNAMTKLDNIDDKTFKDRSNSVIYYEDGSVMKQLNLNDYTYIKYDDIPVEVEEALLSIEDIRFYEHSGVDLKSIARAGYQLVKNRGAITQGGSTITQQLVKLKFLTLEKSYERKLEEVIIAYNLEKQFSKQEILEFYLNTINYGSGAYGIESAAQKYFQKSSKDLSLSEIAFLTGVPNNPTLYSPVNNFENAMKRRDLILKKMLEYEKIDEKTYKETIKEKVILNMREDKYEEDAYDVGFIISSASKEIMKMNDFEFRYWFENEEDRKSYLSKYNNEFKEAESVVRNSGFKIYTTIEKDKQELLQNTVNNSMKDFTGKGENGLYKTQASAVSIDNKKNTLVAIIGGRTQDDIANTYNRAYLSLRQPGSAIKPLLVYLPAFENGVLAEDYYNDEKMKNGPANVDLRYRGNMKIREAVSRSVNTIPYKITLKYGALDLLKYLEEMEFSGLDYRDNNTTIGIGGFTYGTNTYEMANAYHTIVNNGEYINMTGINKILDKYGDVYYKDKKEGKPVYDSGTSYLMTDVLKGVFNDTYGTAYTSKLSRDDIEIAGKTGTTNGYKDTWFAGYTPYYTTTVWVGNDTPVELKNSATYSKKIFKDYMDAVHKNKESATFKMPSRVMELYLNNKTGRYSSEPFSGGVKQLVTAVYLEKLEAEKQAAEIRKRAEEMARQERIKEEEQRRIKQRKDELSKLGMTEADVASEYDLGNRLLIELETIQLNNSSEYQSIAKPLLDKVATALKTIKFSDNYNEFKNRYDTQADVLLTRYNKLKASEEEQRLSEEYKNKLETEFKDKLEGEIRNDYEDELNKLEEEKNALENQNKDLENQNKDLENQNKTNSSNNNNNNSNSGSNSGSNSNNNNSSNNGSNSGNSNNNTGSNTTGNDLNNDNSNSVNSEVNGLNNDLN